MKYLIFICLLLMPFYASAEIAAEVATDVAPEATAKTKTPEIVDYFGNSLNDTKDYAPTGNIDVDFAHAMLAHQAAAEEMAEIHLRYSKDKELRQLSQNIVNGQQIDPARVKAWLQRHEKDNH